MEAFFGNVPDNSRIRVFGCAASVQKQKGIRRDKFGSRSEKGIYLGNEYGLLRVWLSESRRVAMTKQVSFHERQFLKLKGTK